MRLQNKNRQEPFEAWKEAVPYGRPVLAEVCCAHSSPLGSAAQRIGGETHRYAEWNGYDITKKVAALQVLVELRRKRPWHYGSPHRVDRPGRSEHQEQMSSIEERDNDTGPIVSTDTFALLCTT